MKTLTLLTLFVGISSLAQAMEFEKVKLTLWKNSSTIFGREFIISTEKVSDYLDTLPRPNDFKSKNVYECLAKGQSIRHYVTSTGTNPTLSEYVTIINILDIKNCQAVP
jgi:hypothetical protein